MFVRRDRSLLVSLADGTVLSVDPSGKVQRVVAPGIPPTGALAETREGTLWGGTVNGALWRLENGVPKVVNHALAERIVALLVTGADELWAASLGSGMYAALSFADEARIRYRTRLGGLDRDWSEETTDAKIRYTNLPAVLFSRRYDFAVKAQNADGVWSEPLSYRFTIAPPLWLRWWAALAYGAVIVAGAWAINRWRTRQLQRKNRAALPRRVPLLRGGDPALLRTRGAARRGGRRSAIFPSRSRCWHARRKHGRVRPARHGDSGDRVLARRQPRVASAPPGRGYGMTRACVSGGRRRSCRDSAARPASPR